MNKASMIAFGAAMSAGAVAGGFVGNILTNDPNQAEAQQTVDGLMNEVHGVHLSILEQAPSDSCEQNILHYIISRDHRFEFPQSEEELSADFDEVCGDTGLDHAQLGATAFDGFEHIKELRDDITEAQGKAEEESDKPANTGVGVGLGMLVVFCGGAIVYMVSTTRTDRGYE